MYLGASFINNLMLLWLINPRRSFLIRIGIRFLVTIAYAPLLFALFGDLMFLIERDQFLFDSCISRHLFELFDYNK